MWQRQWAVVGGAERKHRKRLVQHHPPCLPGRVYLQSDVHTHSTPHTTLGISPTPHRSFTATAATDGQISGQRRHVLYARGWEHRHLRVVHQLLPYTTLFRSYLAERQ